MKIKEFYTKHKKAIVLGGTAVVGIGVAIALKKSKAAKAVVETVEVATKPGVSYTVIPATEKLANLGFSEINNYPGVYESLADGLKVKDLGVLGEAMQELDKVSPDNEVFILFNVAKDVVKDAAKDLVENATV